MKNNNAILYQGLFVFRNAVLPFVIEQLQAAFGKGWWKAGVQPALGESALDALEKQFERRYKQKLSAIKRPGSQVYEMLDIAHFLPIIRHNWKRCFADTFEQQDTTEVWLREIIQVRNAIAHPESLPLSDEDTWRAFDTMGRFVRLIDPLIAIEFVKIKQDADVEEATTTHPLLDLKEGPYDYEQGFIRLRAIIVEEEGVESEVRLKLERHRDQLVKCLWEKRLNPGSLDGQLENRKEHVLQELDRLTLHYLKDKTFNDLATPSAAPAQPLAPSDALARIRELDREIESLQQELYQKQWKRLAQLQTGEAVPKLERDFMDVQKELDSRRDERARLMETSAPPAYFSVERELDPNGDLHHIECRVVTVSTRISNQGHQGQMVSYTEAMPDGLELLDGNQHLEEYVEPGRPVALSYRFYPVRPGRYQLATAQLDYEGRVKEWDEIEETILEVGPGEEPALSGARYYQFAQGGIQLFVYLENRGDKIARDVQYEDEVDIAGRRKSVKLTWQGNIRGGSGHTVEYLLDISDPTQMRFDEGVKVRYKDSQGQMRSTTVEPGVRRVEYHFPVATDTQAITVGRDAEIQLMSSMLDDILKLARGKPVASLKRLVVIKGIEGTGKTRLVYELVNRAAQHRVTCHVEDAKDRSPVKRMLRRLLGLKPAEDNNELIFKRLEEVLPGVENSLHRDLLYGYVSTIPIRLSEEEVVRLEASMFVLVNVICRKEPTLLAFENIQWTPEGAEEQLLVALFHNTLVGREMPMLLCATYRPGETAFPPVIGKLQMSPTQYTQVELEPISQEAVRALVDGIVQFPRFSEPILRFVQGWSGNPLYLIELLRLLTHPNSRYLARVGSEWYPAPDIKLEEAVPHTIDDVILERVDIELAEEAGLVRVLSAIGFELPLKLVEKLIAHEFPQWPPSELNRRLEALELAGIVSLTASGEYQFEHQLKREVIYARLSEPTQLRLRRQLAEILLSEHVFPDPDEQIRQLARHLVKSPVKFQKAHLKEIKEAAELELGLRDFTRSLEFYNAAVQLATQDSLEKAELLVDRSRLHILQGNWLPASRDLEQANQILSLESVRVASDIKSVTRLGTQVKKEQARVMLRQPQSSLDKVDGLLRIARSEMEGSLLVAADFLIPFGIRQYVLPHELDVYRDLIEIYLALAEVWLIKRDFKICEEACHRAEWLAKKALEYWPHRPFLHEVYLALGNLYLEKGGKKENFDKARHWFEQALRYVKEDRYQQERIGLRLADMYRAIGDSAGARQTYESAIEAQKQLGDVYGLALSFGGLGDLYVEQGQFEEGLYYCKQAYEYQQLVSDLDRFWRTCVSLTKIYLKRGEPDQAAEYWWQSRPILFEQRRVDKLHSRKQREICDLTQEFTQHFRKKQHPEKMRVCLQDLDHLLPLIEWNREEMASLQIELGEVYFKTHQWQEAIKAFEQAEQQAESPAVRAEVLDRLGDVYSAYQAPSRPIIPDFAAQEESQDQAERYFEEAIKTWLHTGNVRRSLNTYEKLLNRIVSDEAGLLQLPFTFLRILREMPLQQKVHDQFMAKAEQVLLRNEKLQEAGDIVVYTAREVAQVDESVISLEDKLAYLRHAESVYRQGMQDDVIWGLNMLIPTFFRLGQWDEVTRCFEELFELNIQVEDSDELIETYKALEALQEKISAEDLERFTTLALAGQRQLSFTNEQRSQLTLYVAKQYSHIAGKVEDAEQKRGYEDLTLEYYERILQTTGEDKVITVVALNDSSLIYGHREEYQEALKRLDKAIQTAERIGARNNDAQSRINRASLYLKLGETSKALGDYERSIELLQNGDNYWKERLQAQDQQSLSPAEIIEMRGDRRWLASGCDHFARLLLALDEVKRAEDLARQAASLYLELGMVEAAEWAQGIAAAAIDASNSGCGLSGILIKGWPCPECGDLILEGVTEYPSCNLSVCPKCGAALKEDAATCPQCGTAFDLVCPRCNTTLGPQDEKCPACGLDFTNLCPQCGKPIDLEQGLCPNCGQAVCPMCGAGVSDDDEKCPSCDAALALFCPKCGMEIAAEDTTCPHCAEPFETEESEEDKQ